MIVRDGKCSRGRVASAGADTRRASQLSGADETELKWYILRCTFGLKNRRTQADVVQKCVRAGIDAATTVVRSHDWTCF